jgi:hypothetical protein
MIFFKARWVARNFANGRKVIDLGVGAKSRWGVKVLQHKIN